jgi:hypothetical protein
VATKARAPSSAQIDRAYAKAGREAKGGGSAAMNVVWRGHTYTLTEDNIGPGDDLICRAQTAKFLQENGVDAEGYTVTGLMASLAEQNGARVGTDVVAVFVWMARRKAGERGLSFAQALDEMGSAVQLMTDLQPAKDGDAVGEGEPGGSRPTPGPSSPSDLGSTPETS